MWAALALPPVFAFSCTATIPLNSTKHYVSDILPSDISTYGIYYYDWSVTSRLRFESSHTYQTDVYVKGITPVAGTISFYTTNGCGTSSFNFPVHVVSALLRIYPNPASNEITLIIDYGDAEYSESELLTENEYSVAIYNNSGTPVFVNRYNNKETKINETLWQNLAYHIKVKGEGEENSALIVFE